METVCFQPACLGQQDLDVCHQCHSRVEERKNIKRKNTFEIGGSQIVQRYQHSHTFYVPQTSGANYQKRQNLIRVPL
jgi:hypothetical protein